MTQLSIAAQVRELKDNFEDFEFYPTMDSQLKRLGERLLEINGNEHNPFIESFLDVGAGNGKVLKYVESLKVCNNFYAIEKSNTHLNNLPENYRILGVDFWNTSFIDKEVSIIFSNCPYSEFGPWIAKLLKETSYSTRLFFILPDRWPNNEEIKEALRVRGAEVKILGSYSFEDSEDRKARAKVDLIEIEPTGGKGRWDKDDPFLRFFEENFKYPEPSREKEEILDKKIEKTQLVTGQNLIEILCELYDKRMVELNTNYSAVCSLPSDFLKEFEISKSDLISSLKQKLNSCKKEYWQRLFFGMKNINRTLTTESQKEITGMMNAQSGIDFNRENAYALVMWTIKNANLFYDKQLVTIYKKMLNHANVDNYKSNQRVFNRDQFRYSWYRSGEESNMATHIKLKVGHRIVLDNCGGLSNSPYSFEKGLTESAANFIRDLLVIGNNLGFEFIGRPPVKGEWDTSEQVEYLYKDKEDGPTTLFTVRAYLNQNLHIKFNPKFIHALNTQAGKLLGWLGSSTEAETELEVDKGVAEQFYSHCFRIGEQQLMLN